MRILFLTSNHPSDEDTKTRAANKILDSLFVEFKKQGHELAWAYCRQSPDSAEEVLSPSMAQKMDSLNIKFLGNFSKYLKGYLPGTNRLISLLNLVYPGAALPWQYFADVPEIIEKIESQRPDAIYLFWDTSFEFLLPDLAKTKIPLFGYLAKARYEAAMARMESASSSVFKKIMQRRLLDSQKKGHLRNLKYFQKISNICDLDARRYEEKGIATKYISNTWPDFFGPPLEVGHDKKHVEILANLSNLGATGNYFGLKFLLLEVLPLLEKKQLTLKMNVCGTGRLPENLQVKLESHPFIHYKGFVADANAEVLNSEIFLILNNVGPHTGGYTRVIYALSAGRTLIAHKKLAESMPEIKHRQNALLGETAEEIADLIVEAVTQPQLRVTLGRAARKTYEEEYAPSEVTKKLIKLKENQNRGMMR